MATQIFLLFPPRKLGQDEPILTIIFFQMGWFNHQLEEDLGFLARFLFLAIGWRDSDSIPWDVYKSPLKKTPSFWGTFFFPSAEQASLRRWEGDHRVTHQVID